MQDRKSGSERAWLRQPHDQVLMSKQRIERSNDAILRSDELLRDLKLGLIGFEYRAEWLEREHRASLGKKLASMVVPKTRVLVLDDEAVVADTLALVLNLSGFDAVAAYDGETGLAHALDKPIDHLVTDVMMHPMNGIEAAIAIRAALPNCTVLLISGDERTAQVLAAAAKDGHHFKILAKPVHPTEILDHLRHAGSRVSVDQYSEQVGFAERE